MSFRAIFIFNLFFVLLISCGVKSPPVSKNHIPSFDSSYKKSLVKNINFNTNDNSDEENKKSPKQDKIKDQNNEAQQ